MDVNTSDFPRHCERLLAIKFPNGKALLIDRDGGGIIFMEDAELVENQLSRTVAFQGDGQIVEISFERLDIITQDNHVMMRNLHAQPRP